MGGENILIYINNSKGLREQKQYTQVKQRESAGVYAQLFCLHTVHSAEGSKWQGLWKTPWYPSTLNSKLHHFGTYIPTDISNGEAKKKPDSQLIPVFPLIREGGGLKVCQLCKGV